jgi:hypothetical protein
MYHPFVIIVGNNAVVGDICFEDFSLGVICAHYFFILGGSFFYTILGGA